MIGQTLLNYKVKSLIGEGGMGNVYLAEHESIGRKVAIKVLRSQLAGNPEVRQRFKNEAAVMSRLQHSGIVTLYDYLEQEDDLYLIMEYVEGKELKELLHQLKEPISFERAKDLMKKMLSAFALAHKKGVVHRDVKPSNIIISDDDDVKILDFGIAKILGSELFKLTKTGTQVGTIYYMSPEQVRAKELDHRSDIYSLGIIFYELLAGFCPYTSLTSEYEIYAKIVQEPLLPLTQTMGSSYQDLWNIIQKATQKDPKDRFQSCEEFIDAIEGKTTIVADPVVHETPADKTTKSSETTKPRKDQKLTSNSEKNDKKKSRVGLFVALSIGIPAILLLIVLFTKPFHPSYEEDDGYDYGDFDMYESDDEDYEDPEEDFEDEGLRVDRHKQIIRDFKRAEDSRNLTEILEYYADDVKQYYNVHWPAVDELRDAYQNAWSGSYSTQNKITRITELTSENDKHVYEVRVTFSIQEEVFGGWYDVYSVLEIHLNDEGRITLEHPHGG